MGALRSNHTPTTLILVDLIRQAVRSRTQKTNEPKWTHVTHSSRTRSRTWFFFYTYLAHVSVFGKEYSMPLVSYDFHRNDWTRRLLTTAQLGSRDGRPVRSREKPARSRRVALAASVSPTRRSARSDHRLVAHRVRACRQERPRHITCFFADLCLYWCQITFTWLAMKTGPQPARLERPGGYTPRVVSNWLIAIS